VIPAPLPPIVYPSILTGFSLAGEAVQPCQPVENYVDIADAVGDNLDVFDLFASSRTGRPLTPEGSSP
jgi:hypothetical protein